MKKNMLLMSLLVLMGSNGVSANWLSNMPSFVSIPDEYKKYVACSAAVVGIGYLVKYTLLSGNNKVATENDSFKEKIYLPLFYSPLYNISFFGIEKLHPFDSQKYGNVVKKLQTFFNDIQLRYHEVQHAVVDKDLERVHSKGYLKSLNSWIPLVSQWNWTKITEIPLPIPNFIIQKKLAQPMKYAVQGTIEAAQHALAHGVAINVGGGYHHAKSTSGGGFCAFNDWAIALKKLREIHSDLKMLYVDLDAHQGNGVEECLFDDKNVHVVDCFNNKIYPGELEKFEKRINAHIDYSKLVLNVCKKVEKLPFLDQEEQFKQVIQGFYLDKVKKYLDKVLKTFKPDIIFYNAGTDCFKEDSLGRMHLTKETIIKRDELVFEFARNNNICICMATSGGYTEDSAGIIASSILNLHDKGLLTHRT